MKAICVAGNSQTQTEALLSSLIKAGVAPALPSKRDNEININVWHEKVLGVRPEKTNSPRIGKLWEQMAVDIFLANHKQEIWCWNHKDSLKIADYWLAFDPGIHFLLVYTPCEDYISEQISATTIHDDALSSSLEVWRQRSQELFDLHEAHPQRTTVIQSTAQYKEFLLSLNSELNNPLRLDQEWKAVQPSDRILECLLRSYAHTQPAVLEIEARASKFAAGSHTENKLFEIIESHLQSRDVLTPTLTSLPLEDTATAGTSSQAHADQISELESEIDLLMAQLHEVQESYDEHLNESATLYKNLEITKGRINRLLEEHPDYWEAEQVLTEYSPHAQSLLWQVSGTYLNNTRFEKLQFQTNITENGVVLILLKVPDTKPLFSRWPYANDKEVTVSYPQNNSEQVAALNSLGVSDWEVFKFLIGRIIGFLKSKSAPKEIKTNFKNKITNGLLKLQQEIENWPLLLRYDSVELIDTLHIGEYQAVGLSLENLQLGNFKVPSFSFRLATFNEAGKPFGAHPRLEFPESCRYALPNWFPESLDERGARLELRFSKPNQMDTNVWSKFSSNEQIFMAALIANLKTQLYFLKNTNPKLPIQWNQWGEVVDFMKSTLSKVYASRNH
ncbi:hypothetical protein I5O09_17455 [Pseudomonas parafulva]|uniref:hypothetical protein n=1 Tax=Pseudomonas parafulva TaxID=157782 RepID=UPI0018D7E582|nr:hypothetical protein [Pseudomonas parafulva]MBH3345530.1 hypothetical protein [Pseudomonas parafulva]